MNLVCGLGGADSRRLALGVGASGPGGFLEMCLEGPDNLVSRFRNL